eukprot:3906533-Rhodomonas_salina.4
MATRHGTKTTMTPRRGMSGRKPASRRRRAWRGSNRSYISLAFAASNSCARPYLSRNSLGVRLRSAKAFSAPACNSAVRTRPSDHTSLRTLAAGPSTKTPQRTGKDPHTSRHEQKAKRTDRELHACGSKSHSFRKSFCKSVASAHQRPHCMRSETPTRRGDAHCVLTLSQAATRRAS